jgi:hypothetical protein
VVIVYATGTEDRGFETRQGVMFLGLYTLQCCSLYLNSHCYLEYMSEINVKNYKLIYVPMYLYNYKWAKSIRHFDEFDLPFFSTAAIFAN